MDHFDGRGYIVDDGIIGYEFGMTKGNQQKYLVEIQINVNY